MNPKILKAWQLHKTAHFPRQCVGQDIAGYDLVLLDANIAGCVQTFIGRKGQLDVKRISILSHCYEVLSIATSELEGEAHHYFANLQMLAGLVLKEIRQN